MLDDFLQPFRTTVLSTLDETGAPYTSYAPFSREANRFYVFLSDMARHSRNLRGDGRVSLFFIEDESRCEQLFARKRVVLRGHARLVPRTDSAFARQMEVFKSRFDAKLVTMLESMQDFNLYALECDGGEAVFGFGDAYDLEGPSLAMRPRGGAGHRMAKENS